MGGDPHRVSSALKFGNTGFCYLENKGHPALEVSLPCPHFCDQLTKGRFCTCSVEVPQIPCPRESFPNPPCVQCIHKKYKLFGVALKVLPQEDPGLPFQLFPAGQKITYSEQVRPSALTSPAPFGWNIFPPYYLHFICKLKCPHSQ